MAWTCAAYVAQVNCCLQFLYLGNAGFVDRKLLKVRNYMNYAEIENICKESKCYYAVNYPLASKTSMKIGGECDIYIEPNSEELLLKLLDACKRCRIPYFILGRGSNLLIKRFCGAVIAVCTALKKITVKNDCITAGAGLSLSTVCSAALENGLSGMESLYGIPGSVGGALYMNAGAFGTEMKDVVISARCINTNSEIVEIPADKMNLRYRGSVFSENGYCILSVTFRLTPRAGSEINARMTEVMQKRREKQPLEYPSCGSTFKRPKNGFAAALIEECGLKGYSVGGAQVSEKHSGFVINKGDATFEDVMALVDHIKKVVREQKGVELECEMLVLK